jgi:hypothetical protein
MNPKEKGWLREYIEFRMDMMKELTTDAVRKGSHPEHSLYRIIQPTGLMYGQSVGGSGHPEQEKWENKERMKVLLAESLITVPFYFMTNKMDLRITFLRSLIKPLKTSEIFTTIFFLNSQHPQKHFLERKNHPWTWQKEFLTSE